MKITSVEIQPEGSSDICALSFRDPRRQNPYNIMTITGLDVEELTPQFYGKSGVKKFYNLTMQKREIGIQIELNPNFSADETYSALRDTLYKFISASRTGLVEIRFKNDGTTVAAVSGFFIKFETPHSTETPNIVLRVDCKEAMLKAPTRTVIDTSALDPASTNIVDVLSTAPHGFIFEMAFTGALASFVIRDSTDLWDFEVIPLDGFLVDDVLHFSSESNNKYLYIQRSASVIHLADVVTPGSFWPMLFPGDNNLICESPTSLDWVSVEHYATYWGI